MESLLGMYENSSNFDLNSLNFYESKPPSNPGSTNFVRAQEIASNHLEAEEKENNYKFHDIYQFDETLDEPSNAALSRNTTDKKKKSTGTLSQATAFLSSFMADSSNIF